MTGDKDGQVYTNCALCCAMHSNKKIETHNSSPGRNYAQDEFVFDQRVNKMSMSQVKIAACVPTRIVRCKGCVDKLLVGTAEPTLKTKACSYA